MAKKASPLKLPSKSELQQRFHELKAEIETHEAKTLPIRQKREELIAKHEKEIRELEAKFNKMDGDVGLFDMKMELGQIVNILKGHTGDPAVEAANAAANPEAKEKA